MEGSDRWRRSIFIPRDREDVTQLSHRDLPPTRPLDWATRFDQLSSDDLPEIPGYKPQSMEGDLNWVKWPRPKDYSRG